MHMPGREDTRVCETCVSIRDSDDDVWGLEPPVVPRVAYVASPTDRAVNGRAAAVEPAAVAFVGAEGFVLAVTFLFSSRC